MKQRSAFLPTLVIAAFMAVAPPRSELQGTSIEQSPASPPVRCEIAPVVARGVLLPARGGETISGMEGAVEALYEPVSNPRLSRFRTSSDVPRYNEGFSGNAVLIGEGGTGPRSDRLIAVQSGYITGGGCFPVSPDSTACLMEPDSTGTPRAVWKERERWTFRISYIDPSDPAIPERNLTSGDLTWLAHTTTGRSCFAEYAGLCDYYGFDLDEIVDLYQGFTPDCALKLGAGYRSQIFYQYSRYSSALEGTLPPGTIVWEPPTIPATPTRLDQPGKELWVRNWVLGPGENALALSLSDPIHPAVTADTGYPTVAPTIAPGSATLTVRTYDCGSIANVPFTIERELVEKSGGHDHTNAPNLDRIASLAAYGGSTDSGGVWTTTVTAGEVGATVKLTAAAGSLLGQPFSKSLEVPVGFAGLVDPGVSGVIRYTGSTSNHPLNHFGSPELHEMVRVMAEYYNALADPADQGSLGINDMSLRRGGLFDISGNWLPSHYRHRFGTDSDVDRRVLTAGGTYEFLDTDVLRSVVEDDLDGIFILESGGRMHVQVPEYRVGEILLRGTR